MVTNNATETLQLSARIVDADGVEFLILNRMDIPPNDFAVIELGKQNLRSGERLDLKTENFQGAIANLSYVLNQREEYTVIT